MPPPPPLPEEVVAVPPEPEAELAESTEPLPPLPSAALEGDRPILRLRVPGTRRHLNFFRKMVVKPEKFIRAGTIVNVVDRNGELIGCGFYNPKSEIALRMLGPWQEDLIETRLKAAIAFRESLKIPATAYRVCHGEADGLPGLIIDRYADVHSIQVFTLGMLKHIEEIRALFPKTFVTADERAQTLEGFTLPPEKPPESVVVEEHGVAFRVDFEKGHKTGFFCDQRENRKLVADLSRGKSVLDLCCYTGGFSISAAKAGAQRVTAVDMDEDVLDTARQNERLNKVKVDFLHADVFNYCRQSREQFDVVILDPPKLARDRDELVKAKRTYFDMNRLALQRVKPGGLFVTNSCSGLLSEPEFLDILQAASSDRELRIFKVAGAGPDHPWSTLYPEGRYLKVVYAVVV